MMPADSPPALLRLLLVEDDEDDAFLVRDLLAEALPEREHRLEHAASFQEGLEALSAAEHDIVLCDLRLGAGTGLEIMERARALDPLRPFIILTGQGDERVAAEVMRKGATDYLPKSGLDAQRLATALRHALELRAAAEETRRAQEEKEALIVELREALAKVKTLRGLLPVCASCKKVRDDQGYWTQIDEYLREHSEADVSHGICPDCARRLYPELYEEEEGG
jgi:DNA-binding NtrC family response regulator